jgi:CelD/BcsL family acetyltransferase involved in cellulose biosynthesis
MSDHGSTATDIQITEETIESLVRMRKTGGAGLKWHGIFALPEWMEAWLGCCRDDHEVSITAFRHGGKLLGLAPLLKKGHTAGLIGSPDLCDYLDLPIAEEHAQRFYGALLSYLSECGIRQFHIGPLREDSPAVRDFPGIAEENGWQAVQAADEVSYEMALPETWEAYLSGLKGKQRHEVRRKLRRLSENGMSRIRSVESPRQLAEGLDTFLDLFRQSRVDKNEFLTGRRLAFFQRLTANMAAAGMLRLYFLDIDRRPAACALCFEDADTLYLYNSGYDRQFAALSVGQVCTFLTIKEGIAKGLRDYNFLKGDEVYKKRLGGKPVQLVRLSLEKKVIGHQ